MERSICHVSKKASIHFGYLIGINFWDKLQLNIDKIWHEQKSQTYRFCPSRRADGLYFVYSFLYTECSKLVRSAKRRPNVWSHDFLADICYLRVGVRFNDTGLSGYFIFQG